MLKKIYVEITNICNYSCSFCKGTKRDCGFITVEKFEILISKIKDYTKYIYLHVLGEPLLHKDIKQLIEIANINGINVSITTNASLISQKQDILLSSDIRQINYSLHSVYEDNIDETKIIKDVANFINQCNLNDKKTFHSLRLWNVVDDVTINNKIVDLLLQNIDNALISYDDTIANLDVLKSVKLAERVFLETDKLFYWPDLNNEIVSKVGKCYGLKSNIGILLDGTVVPCCLDCEGDISLGNIYEDDLGDILSSKRAVNMANGFRNNKLVENLCQTCGFAMRLNKNI